MPHFRFFFAEENVGMQNVKMIKLNTVKMANLILNIQKCANIIRKFKRRSLTEKGLLGEGDGALDELGRHVASRAHFGAYLSTIELAAGRSETERQAEVANAARAAIAAYQHILALQIAMGDRERLLATAAAVGGRLGALLAVQIAQTLEYRVAHAHHLRPREATRAQVVAERAALVVLANEPILERVRNAERIVMMMKRRIAAC